MTKTRALRLILAAIAAVSVSAFSQQPPQARPQQPTQQQHPPPQMQQPIGRPAPVERYNVSGDKIVDYFDVHAAELRSVLRQLSAYSGRDIISNDGVKATVTLSVTNKSWREILAIVCMVHSLAFVEEPSFIYVMTREQAATYASGVGKMGDGTGGMPMGLDLAGPLVREVIPMRFTTADETGAAVTPFLSQRGKLTSIKHTNAIVIVDTDDNLRQLKNLVAQIDVQTPQVSISCKIIEASTDAVQSMGVHWGLVNGKNNFTVNQFGNSFTEMEGIGKNAPLMAASAQHTVTYGLLTPEKFGVALEYLFQDNKTEIVAQPQITTLNNKEAQVSIGQEIPINTRDEAGNTITDNRTAETRLTVTPYVSGEGKIGMDLKVSKQSFELSDLGAVINNQSANTNVLVNNGETVVIAGLTSNEKKSNSAGIPFLKDIPILGYLFKRSQKSATKRDLVIFVTPHIIHSEI
jgi:type IV pilus assembly protein PilQ